MTLETPLDLAHAAHEADPDDEALRLRFHERLLDAELMLPVAGEDEAAVAPQVFALTDGQFVLAFDRDERLAAFLEAPTPFVALSGRRLVAELAGRGIGIGLNLGAVSAALLPAETVDWLAAIAATPTEAAQLQPAGLSRPRDVSPALLTALGTKLAAMAGVVEAAHLVAADGGTLILVLVGVPEPAQAGVAAGIAEAVRLGGLATGWLDVAFLDPGSPAAEAAGRAGIRLDLPVQKPSAPAGPGMDPQKPPKLRRNQEASTPRGPRARH